MAGSPSPPPSGTVERWAWDYVVSRSLGEKRAPSPAPTLWEVDAPPRRIGQPGRPPELRVVLRAGKTRGLAAKSGRARALHTFFHHELQAAELMLWALLAFPDADPAFRNGLLRIAEDEMRHMRLYAEGIQRLGYEIGAFTVRDWFWERVPRVVDARSFVATMGLGFEGANLEHAAWFAARFREAGDEESALLQEVVGREEIAHVRFGAKWFAVFTGSLAFHEWRDALPPPLSPLLMRGRKIDRSVRLRAGFTEPFLDELEAWGQEAPGS